MTPDTLDLGRMIHAILLVVLTGALLAMTFAVMATWRGLRK